MAFSVLGAACAADGNNAMIVMNIGVPSGEDCVVEPSAATFSDSGLFDIESGGSFEATARIKGTLAEDPNAGTRHHVAIQSATVVLLAAPSQRSETLIAGLGELAHRTVLTSGTLEPGDGSLITLGITMIDSEQTAAIASSGAYEPGVQVVANFKFHGTVDGNDVDSYTFNYPITLCTDCVLDFADCPLDEMGKPITDLDDCMLPNLSDYSRGTLCNGDQIP